VDEPTISAYVPAENPTQAPAPLVSEYFPMLQDKHVVLDDDPSAEEYLPGTHSSKNDPILSRLYVLIGHGLHSCPGTSVAHSLLHMQNSVFPSGNIELRGHLVHKPLDGLLGNL